MPSKHEPIDFFGDCIILVDRVARGPERGHPLLEIVIGQPGQERVGTKGRLFNEAPPVGGGNLRHDLMHNRRKAACCEDGLDVPPRRKVGIDQRPQCRKEMSMREVSLTGAVTDANVAALAQYAMASRATAMGSVR